MAKNAKEFFINGCFNFKIVKRITEEYNAVGFGWVFYCPFVKTALVSIVKVKLLYTDTQDFSNFPSYYTNNHMMLIM